MPIVNIDAGWLNRLLGREFAAEELTDALEQIGCDVEDVVEISRYRCPGCSSLVEGSAGVEEVRSCPFCGIESETAFAQVDTVNVIRLDLLAARPDLFDIGGLARALRGFLGLAQGLPAYTVAPGKLKVHVDPLLNEPDSYRPLIRCAVVTMPAIDETTLVAIMKLQENLHWGIGRDRKLASIGVYDLDTLDGDIRYTTLAPDKEKFVPLGLPDHQMTGREILESHPKGMAYAHLLEKHLRYPVLIDERGQVLSMPPIINSEETKLRQGSTRLFIDVTGISEAAVVKSLDTLVSSLIEIGGQVESVTLETPSGSQSRSLTSPDLTPRTMEINLPSANAWLGIPFDEASLIDSLHKMRLDVEPVPGKENYFSVRYPAFRTDIRHMVDMFEDLAIGYGYVNIEPRLVPTLTVGDARAEETLSEIVRNVLLGLGFSEVMSLPLNTEEDHFLRLRAPVPEHYPRIENPKLKALKVVRTHLISGLLQALYENRKRPMPLRLFEIDNVATIDPEAETGVREERRVAFVEMGPEAGYASARSVLDAILREMELTGSYEPSNEPMFTPGRAANVAAGKDIKGRLGELHPEVITGESLVAAKLRKSDTPPILEQPAAIAELILCRVL